MELLFWMSVTTILYVYLGYPVILLCISKLFSAKTVDKKDFFPKVSLVISAYNEEAVIAEKIKNSLALDYPVESFEIVVVSDASSDATDDIVRQFASSGNVRLFRQEERLGKTAGLNAVISSLKGNLVVFSDANAIYSQTAIKKLVRHFNDLSVGYVVGESRYVDIDSLSGESENAYWKYEQMMKRMESNICSVVGGDGAMYSIRKELYEPLGLNDINDFLNPNQIVMKGYRGVYEPEAYCSESPAESSGKEFKRKVRIVSRSFRSLAKVLPVLNPAKSGIFAFCIISHKLLRWFVPVFMIVALVSNLMLVMQPFYTVMLLLQTLFYSTALLGWLVFKEVSQYRLLYIIYYFCVINVASLFGIFKAVSGKTSGVWDTVRTP